MIESASSRPRRPYASWIKIVALVLLLIACRDFLGGEPSPVFTLNLEMPSKSSLVRDVGRLVFPAVWFGCLVSIFLSPFLSATLLRVPLTLLFLLSWLFSITVLTLGQAGGSIGVVKDNTIESGTLALFWLERRKLLDTMHTYSETLPVLVAFALIAVILAWKPSPGLSVRGRWNIVACLPLVAAFGMAAYSRGGTSEFPTPVGMPIRFANAIAFVAQQDEVAETFHSRPVTLQADERRFEKIILIMDESVRAGFVKTEPFPKWGVTDFGTAVSAGNCSHFARFIFKRGLRPETLPQAFLTHGLASEEPTIWQYAKAAGYRTVYIDAVGDAIYHSGMNSDELGYIDERYNILSRPIYMRDFDALNKLFDVMAKPGPAFIYLDKQGAHHAYQTKYPTDRTLNAEGPAVKRPDSAEMRDYQKELLERYNKAVDWSVNKFLAELFAKGLPGDSLMIYTSDHGQSLVENQSKWTHCSSGNNAATGEGLVPLFVYANTGAPGTASADAGGAALARQLRKNAEAFAGKYSHFEVFPTLLIGLGYPEAKVRQLYGNSLLDPPPPRRQFLKGGDVRNLEWHPVD